MLAAGPQLDVPQDVTPAQLETLLNGLLQNEERLPSSFFVEDTELAAELGQHLLKNKVRAWKCSGKAEYFMHITVSTCPARLDSKCAQASGGGWGVKEINYSRMCTAAGVC